MGFSGSVSSKESACNVGELGSIPGSGRSPGEGNGNPLQCSCLENPMDRGAWRATVHRVTKSGTRVKRLGTRTSKDVQEWYEPKEGNRRGPRPPGKHNPSESRRWNSAPTAWFHLGSELCLARSSAHSTRVTPKFLQSLDLPASGIRPCLTSHGYWPAGVGGPAICREGVISGGPSKTLPTL